MSLFEPLRQKFIQEFHEKGESVLPAICNSSVIRRAFLAKYKDLPPIEQMPDHEKKEMKRYVHNMFPGRPVEFKLEAAKVIYCIGTLL